MPNDYSLPRQARKSGGKLPESDRKTLTPDYLLGHENHFDPNVYTPQQMIQGNPKLGGHEPIKVA